VGYVLFEERDLSEAGWPKDKRTIAVVSRSRGDVLGVLSYHAPWREWVMDAAPDVIWSQGCLMDVASKLAGLNIAASRARRAS
jgi:predicted transglutaminase-like cysteine proteinase